MRRSGKKNPLGRRLFIATLLIGTVVMSCVAGLRGMVTAVRTRERFTEELQQEAHAHQYAIAEALWALDRKGLAAQLQAIVASTYISFASVVDETGDMASAGTRRRGGGFELTIPIQYVARDEPVTIGALTLQADLETLRNIAWSWVFEDLPITTLGLALVAAILYLYFERVVTRRLEKDAKRLAAFKLDGAELPFPDSAKYENGEIETLETSFNELTSRLRSAFREAENARVEAEASERRNQALFDHSPVALCLVDFSAVRDLVVSLNPGAGPGEAEAFFVARPELLAHCSKMVVVLAVNEATLELLEAKSPEQILDLRELLFSDGAIDIFITQLAATARGETRAFGEGVIRTITGDERRVAVSWEVLSSESANKTRASYTRAILAIVDVTERVRTQEAISANLREKEVLIRELFHRTKNNMQSILSLISFQSWKIQDENLREAMRALETRVYSMSLVHRMLYEYNDLSRLSLSAFIREFSAYLSASEDIEARGIRFELRLEEIEVTIDVAVPLGLVIAELVDNSLIHGFPNKRAGVITVELTRVDNDHIALTISDDGVGPGPGFEAEVDGAMGLQLVDSLAESQLGGRANFDVPPEGGFRCRITARPDIYTIRV